MAKPVEKSGSLTLDDASDVITFGGAEPSEAATDTAAATGTADAVTKAEDEPKDLASAEAKPVADGANDAAGGLGGVELCIIVKGPAKGRWRIGRHFTPQSTAIPVHTLSEDQLQALINDPELKTVIAETSDF